MEILNTKFKIEVISEEGGQRVYIMDLFPYLYIQIYFTYFDCYIQRIP